MKKLKFTRTAVEKLPLPEKGQVAYWDTEVPGFGVRVCAGGAKTYFVFGRLNRRPVNITIGRTSLIYPEPARREAKDYLYQLSKGFDPRPSKKPTESTCFGDLLLGYADLLESRGKASARSVRNALERNVHAAFPKLWSKPAAEISLEDCVAIVGRLVDQDKRREADKVRSYIRAAFTAAITAKGEADAPARLRAANIQVNPARELARVKGSSHARGRVLAVSELRSYWKRVKKLPEPKRSVLAFHLLTGAQRVEQLSRATQSASVDRDSKTLMLLDRKGRRESAKCHYVPLLDEAISAMDRMGGSGDYVLSADGGVSPIGSGYLRAACISVADQMIQSNELSHGIFTPAVLRATVETRLLESPYRVSSDVLGSLLSHGQGGVQKRHYQFTDLLEEKRDALAKLLRLLEGREEPKAEVIKFRARQ